MYLPEGLDGGHENSHGLSIPYLALNVGDVDSNRVRNFSLEFGARRRRTLMNTQGFLSMDGDALEVFSYEVVSA
jgi:hypothetical protein